MNKEDYPKILFVDDEKNILNTIKRTFIRQKFKVFIGNSAQEGLEILESNDIDIVVSDVKMPEMDGIEFLTKVKEKYPEINRIILSGYVEKSSVINAILTGVAFTYLTKPWKNDELTDKLRHVSNIKKILTSVDVLTKVNKIEKLPDVPELYQNFIDAVAVNASIHDISDIISKDLSLATKILQVINSAFYSTVQISSLDKAVSLLGLNNLKSIIFSTIFMVDKEYSVKEKRELIKLNRVSYKVNKALQKIYLLKYGEKLHEDYKSLGLLYEIGKFVLIKEFSDEYFQIQDLLLKEKKIDFYTKELELSKTNCTYREIGAYFLQLWNFPQINITASLFDVDIDLLNEIEDGVIKTLHLADKLVKFLENGIPLEFYESYEFRNFGLSKTQLEEVINDL